MEGRRGSRGVTKNLVTKSPSRNKSPGRKSPSRKSPSRKSPGRKLEPTIKEENLVKARPRGRPKTVVEQPKKLSPKSELRKVSLSPIQHESARSSVHTKTSTTTTSTSVKVSNISNESDEEVRRYVARKMKFDNLRLSSTPSETSRHTRSHSVSVVDGDDSDHESEPIFDEDRIKYEYRPVSSQKSHPSIWVGLRAFSFILLISIFGFYLCFACSRNECDFTFNRWKTLKSLRSYGTWPISVSYICFICSILLLSLLPVGKSISFKSEKLPVVYNFNGFALCVIAGIAFLIGEYLDYPVIRFIYGNYQQFCLISIIHALIVSWWRCIISKDISIYERNPSAKSGSFWQDYLIGREINPRWFDIFDIKLIHYRAAAIITLSLNGIIIYRNLKFAVLTFQYGKDTLSMTEFIWFAFNNAKYDSIALVTACLVFWHALDLLIFEHHLSSSFYLQGEGVGAFLLLRHAIFPFMNTLISKYAWEHKITGVPRWAIFATIAIYSTGWFLKRASNKIKYEYRMDPSNEKFSHAETIPTFQAKRLLVYSYWSLIRQPNYLGEIISYLSLMIPLIWRFAWPPFIAILATIVYLVYRANQMSNRNFSRYNSAWTRYCQKVKYVLFPKVI